MQIIWLNYQGNEVHPALLASLLRIVLPMSISTILPLGPVQVSYGRVQPKGVRVIYTYGNHPWLFREVETRCRMNCQDQQVGPQLRWQTVLVKTPAPSSLHCQGAALRCCMQLIYAASAPVTKVDVGGDWLPLCQVSITQAPLLPWSVATHQAFPAHFRRAAIALLLCHKRLECTDTSEGCACMHTCMHAPGGSTVFSFARC